MKDKTIKKPLAKTESTTIIPPAQRTEVVAKRKSSSYFPSKKDRKSNQS